jgi:Bacterial TSP3 repeat
MKRSHTPLFLSLLLAQSTHLSAADPGWWATRGVTTAASPSNKSPATIGQAKHMVSNALAELQTRLPASEYSALQAEVTAVVNLALPVTPADFEKQRAVLLVGQVKALAQPFYDRLRSLDPAWLNQKMYQLNIRLAEPGSPAFTYSPYPWTVSTTDDSNKAVATTGQLKSVFALPLEFWVTPDSLNPALPWGPVDTDGDGLSDITEIAMGTIPSLLDSDNDGYSDGADAYPLDSTRWTLAAGSAADFTGPVITLIEPVGAVLVP